MSFAIEPSLYSLDEASFLTRTEWGGAWIGSERGNLCISWTRPEGTGTRSACRHYCGECQARVTCIATEVQHQCFCFVPNF